MGMWIFTAAFVSSCSVLLSLIVLSHPKSSQLINLQWHFLSHLSSPACSPVATKSTKKYNDSKKKRLVKIIIKIFRTPSVTSMVSFQVCKLALHWVVVKAGTPSAYKWGNWAFINPLTLQDPYRGDLVNQLHLHQPPVLIDLQTLHRWLDCIGISDIRSMNLFDFSKTYIIKSLIKFDLRAFIRLFLNIIVMTFWLCCIADSGE